MSTLIDYVTINSELSFEELEFNEVDGLIFSYTSSFFNYSNFKQEMEVSFSDFNDEKYIQILTELKTNEYNNYELLKTMSQSKRYREVKIEESKSITNLNNS